MDMKNAVNSLSALAQTSRLAVFRTLVELAPDGAYPGEIAQRLDIPANTLSFHLKSLAQAGLINAEQSGRFIRYRADITHMQSLLEFLTRNCCSGQPEKCAPSACSPALKSASRKIRRT